MTEAENIPARVKAVMERYKLKQKEIADQLYVDGSYISRILSGGRMNISRRVLERLESLEARGPVPQAMSGAKSARMEMSAETHRSEAPPRRNISADAEHNSARSLLEARRVAAGISRQALSEATGCPVGVIQALEEGSGRISERLAEKFAAVIPDLEVEDLLRGSDSASIVGDKISTYGTKPKIKTPPGVYARYVPLISWAKCGELTDFSDEVYDYEGYLAFNVQDSRAIAVTLKGDSMEPRFKEGDVAILYPSRKAQTGNLVIARIKDEGVVFKKFQILSQKPPRFRFISENPAYEPIERTEDEIDWIYPVANVVNNVL